MSAQEFLKLIRLFAGAFVIVVGLFWLLVDLCLHFDVSLWLAGMLTVVAYVGFLAWYWRRAEHG